MTTRATAAGDRSAVDRSHMERALELAARGEGQVEPNPPVGAVLAAPDGRVLGEGWHRRFGGPHAEVEAIEAAARVHGLEALAGGTLYVTLEPCTAGAGGETPKKTPPCVDAILAARLARVVAACEDPNPNVAGKGLALLREAGLAVESGLCGERAGRLVEPFALWVRERRPLVTAKWAMSLDGRTAAGPGQERWISSEASRREVHELRGKVGAVIVGIGTVESDDPELSCRAEGGRQPRRVVLDSGPSLALESRLASTLELAPLWVATTERGAATPRAEELRRRGARVLACGPGPRVDLRLLLGALAADGVVHVLVEGGPRVQGSFWDAGLVDRALVYVAPRFLGSGDGSLAELVGVRSSGPDVVIEVHRS